MYLTAEGKKTLFSYEESYAQAFIRNMHEDLNDVKRSFIKIGFRLVEANENKYYKELGYENLVELAEAEFGFKSSTTYEFMKVYELAHDENYRMGIAAEYDKYSYSQLLALTYLKRSARNAKFLVKPTDSVRNIKRFVSIWNEEAKGWSSYDVYPKIKTVDEYLKAYDEKQAQEQAQKQLSEYAGQLPGQIAIDEEPQEEEFSERSEKFEKVIEALEEPPKVLPDNELIEYVLKTVQLIEHQKASIYEKWRSEPTKAEFKGNVKEAYGWGGCSGDNYFKQLESDPSKGLMITRLTGGKLIISWAIVASKISKLIERGEYVTELEIERYKQWKITHGILPATTDEPNELEEEFSEHSENFEEEQVQQQPKREYSLKVKKQTIRQLMFAMIEEHCDMESVKVCKLEDELSKQTNKKFYSYHFSDLAEFIIESDVPEEKYTEIYCGVLSLLGVEVINESN